MRRIVLLAALVGVLRAQASLAQPGENLALGKKYTLDPRPAYQHCTDPDDKVQLTDGVYSKGYFWTQKSTVGWQNVSFAVVTIDLGAVQPISGASFNTAAGVAGVTWPMAVYVLVSDDGKTYTVAGDLVELGAEHGKPPLEGYGLHRYWTDKLTAHGRFVAILLAPSGPYSFADEIEVYRGKDEWIAQPMAGRKVEDVKQFFHEIEITSGVRRRLGSDLAAVREAMRSIDRQEEVEKELDAIAQEIPRIQVIPSEDFKTILPLNDLHKRIFAAQAMVWRSAFRPGLIVWQKNRWDMLTPTEPPTPGGARVDVAMMGNEFRSAAFQISNASDAPAAIHLSISDLPGGPNPKYITVHDAPFTDTKSGVPVVAALPPARSDGQGFLLDLLPGMTRQVWLTFNPKDVPAGEYKGRIALEPGAIQVPVRLKIYPFTFPDQPTLHLGGWDYTDCDKCYEVTPENQQAVIRHLREHFVDTPWAQASTMPAGKYDAEGNPTEPPSAERFEKWIQRWPGARNYYVFAAVHEKFAGFEMGTPPFKKALAAWITWWVNKLSEWNIKPEQLGLLIVDEPSVPEQDKIIVEYARVIREAQPKVVIWEDVTWREPWKTLPELFEVCHTLCPNLPMWIDGGKPFADFYVKQRDAGRELWFYSCSGPGKLLDPYAYHRLQHWFCWRYDAKGSCFWAFGDSNGASSWNEYSSRVGAYTPFFLDEKTVTPGKHMEAIREGMEDYEYLRMLRDRVAEMEAKGAQGEPIASAKNLLASAADRVTACMNKIEQINWIGPKDRSVADQVRGEILEALLKLKDR